jgi:GNAT superfamily N-acetyltransferase
MAGVPAEVRAVTAVDDVLRRELLQCWIDVSNAGGAVGFVPPVTEDDVAPLLDRLLEGVHSGRDVLALLTVDGETAGFATLVGDPSPLRRHWATVLRVQVHPSRQGAGLGRVLMGGVHDIARARGWEFLSLTARGGTGVDGFYRGLGYSEFGRLPGAIRVAPGDDREEILLASRLCAAGRVVGMSAPDPGPGPSRDVRRERLIGLLLLGVAVVLLVSSVTWFDTGQQLVGIGQLFLGAVLAGVGGLLYRRASRG